ncbi:MAG TPA: hypothetical protein VFW63_13980 [Acidimicrobiales bacterium]|nr:hypothetical protein [Acidimicrobiales bacterium]
MTRRRRAVLAVGLVAVVAVAVAARFLDDRGDRTTGPATEVVTDAQPELDYVIPPGTADLVAAGEQVEILPRQITARVGDVIRIDNRDGDAHTLGPWYVGPGEVVTQRFASAGTFEGECNVHPSGQLRVVVEP